MRIEGLWGAPPTPVWPGSAQTALLFVGLPLLTALVLMATPLHDATPPAREEAPAALVADAAVPPAAVADSQPAAAPKRRQVARPQRIDPNPVPAVIWEVRRTIHRRLEHAPVVASGAPAVAPASRTSVWLQPVPIPESVTLTGGLKRPDYRGAAASWEPQSP